MSEVRHDTPLFHGGDLVSASQDTGIPIDHWIDLSTGISPYAYPAHTLPTEAFTRLPYLDEAFKNSAAEYYGSKQFVALPGTQTAIQLLPKILPKLPILLPSIGYQEHAHAWKSSGNTLSTYNALDNDSALSDIEECLQKHPQQHLLIINPNNPSTLCFTPTQLRTWAQQLGQDAYLIVDEAFIDTSPENSLLDMPSASDANIIVLRSFGKFFGLAGIRLGFIFASDKILRQIDTAIPVWSINGPALHLARQAFSDTLWQTQHQKKIRGSEHLTRTLFEPLPYRACYHQQLFSSYIFSSTVALTIFSAFYKEGILLRLIAISDTVSIIRIGRIQVEDNDAQARITAILQTCLPE